MSKLNNSGYSGSSNQEGYREWTRNWRYVVPPVVTLDETTYSDHIDELGAFRDKHLEGQFYVFSYDLEKHDLVLRKRHKLVCILQGKEDQPGLYDYVVIIKVDDVYSGMISFYFGNSSTPLEGFGNVKWRAESDDLVDRVKNCCKGLL